MNVHYATLQNYNEVMDSDLSEQTAQPDDNEKIPEYNMKEIYVFEAILEGDNAEPPIPTLASGYVTLVLDRDLNGMKVNVYVRHLQDPLSCVVTLINLEGEKSKTVMNLWKNKEEQFKNIVTGTIESRFVTFFLTAIGADKFMELVKEERLMISIGTKKYPYGEIDGLIRKIY